MKNLATCTPREFFVQTNKIRKQAQHWMDITKVMEIRKTLPNMDGMDDAQKKSALNKQARENISAMLDAALEANVDETVELLAMLCFVEPADVDKYQMYEYLGAFNELISYPEVLGFFTSLMQLAQMTGFSTAKA